MFTENAFEEPLRAPILTVNIFFVLICEHETILCGGNGKKGMEFSSNFLILGSKHHAGSCRRNIIIF